MIMRLQKNTTACNHTTRFAYLCAVTGRSAPQAFSTSAREICRCAPLANTASVDRQLPIYHTTAAEPFAPVTKRSRPHQRLLFLLSISMALTTAVAAMSTMCLLDSSATAFVQLQPLSSQGSSIMTHSTKRNNNKNNIMLINTPPHQQHQRQGLLRPRSTRAAATSMATEAAGDGASDLPRVLWYVRAAAAVFLPSWR